MKADCSALCAPAIAGGIRALRPPMAVSAAAPVGAGRVPLARSTPHSYHLARPMSAYHCAQAPPGTQPPSGAFIVNFHAALGAAPPRMKARIAPCLRQSTLPLRSVLNKRRWRLAPRNPAPRYSDFPLLAAGLRFAPVVARRVPLARSNRPHTLGLSNVHTQGQINLPLRLPT